MKIEVGKYYRTRNGRKIHIFAENPDIHYCGSSFRFIGNVLYHREILGIYSWAMDGISNTEIKVSDLDIIEEWKEPRVIEGFVEIIIQKIEKYAGFNIVTNNPDGLGEKEQDYPDLTKFIRKIRYTEGGKIEDITDE